jgi:hypothetical protein
MEQIEKSPLRALFWKDEILQILYWMDGEGFGQDVPVSQVLALLNTNKANLVYHLDKLVSEDILKSGSEKVNESSLVSLSKDARKEAGGRFAEAFQGYQKAGHGECGPDCEFCYGTDGVKLENCVHNCGSAQLYTN